MRRDYTGGAQASVLTALLGASTTDKTIYCNDLTGWPTGAGSRPFYIVIDRGKSSEEKILCASRSGNILSVYDDGVTNGRGADDTSITSHAANAVVEHVFTATDANEANAHVNASGGVHGVAGVLAGVTATQTFTNKTMSGSDNTFSAIPQSAVTNLASDLALKAPLSLTINAQTDSYTLVIGDANKQVEINKSTGTTLTVPLNSSVAFPIGTTVLLLQTGAGQVTVAGASGVTVNGTPGLKLRTQWSAATLVKRATDIWVLIGDTSA